MLKKQNPSQSKIRYYQIKFLFPQAEMFVNFDQNNPLTPWQQTGQGAQQNNTTEYSQGQRLHFHPAPARLSTCQRAMLGPGLRRKAVRAVARARQTHLTLARLRDSHTQPHPLTNHPTLGSQMNLLVGFLSFRAICFTKTSTVVSFYQATLGIPEDRRQTRASLPLSYFFQRVNTQHMLKVHLIPHLL